MNYAVIGTGWIAESYIRGTQLAENINLTAVYSRTAEKGLEFGSKFSCTNIYTDLTEFAKAEEFDSVYIASPNVFHYRQSKLMLENGKNVICEKPAAVTPEQLTELFELAESKGLIFTEAMMMAYNPVSLKIKEAIGKIGEVHSAHFDFSQLSSKYPAYKRGELPNIFNPEMATGCLMDLGCYCVYASSYFFGMPDAMTAHSVFLDTGADASTSAILIYPDMDISITSSKVGQDFCGSQIIGDLGTIKIESISKLTNSEIIFNDGVREKICGDVPKEVLMKYEAESFRDFVSDYEQNKNKYLNAKKHSINTCIMMQDIREKAGIIIQK